MKRQELWKDFNATEKAELFCSLYERWQDEKEYEDINDYLDVMKKHVPSAFKIKKRPFAIVCKCDDGLIEIACKVKGKYLAIVGKAV